MVLSSSAWWSLQLQTLFLGLKKPHLNPAELVSRPRVLALGNQNRAVFYFFFYVHYFDLMVPFLTQTCHSLD